MKHVIKAVVLSVFIVMLAAGVSRGQSKDAAPAIDPQAEKIIQQMKAQKKKNMKASVEVLDTMDEVDASGQKLQYSHVRKLKVSEPDRFRLESTGDITNTTIWKDKKTFTLLDRGTNAYAQAAAPGTISETMDMLLDSYGVSTPLADMLSDDLYDVLMKKVITCRYLGLHYAEGLKCHHIAATQKNIDWQIWVDAGKSPRLRKLIITYKHKPGDPQYTAVLKSFKKVSTLPEKTFVFKAPEGAQKMPLLPVKKSSKKQP